MKKLFVSLLLCAAFVLSLGLCAHAEAKIDYVTDTAGILSEDSRAALNEQARAISEQTGCGVYIVTVDDYTRYVKGSIEDFSEAVYRNYELGEGEGKDGVLLAMSMNERDYDSAPTATSATTPLRITERTSWPTASWTTSAQGTGRAASATSSAMPA